MTSGAAIALTLVIAGLCASTLHLANPRNAWRSLARWRSSWLSREALGAMAFIPFAIAYIAMHAFDGVPSTVAIAAVIVLLAWVMLYCTAMIYASLKPIRQWHTARVPLAFWLLAHASGALLIARLLDIGHSKGTFLTDEFVHASAEATKRLLRAALVAGFGIPLLWLAAGLGIPLPGLGGGHPDWRIGAAAFVACVIGMTAERWLFFAEARHTVRLYHGDATT